VIADWDEGARWRNTDGPSGRPHWVRTPYYRRKANPVRTAILGVSLATVSVGAGWWALGRLAAAPQEQREEIVELIRSGELAGDGELGHVPLPEEYRDATVHGDVQILAGEHLTVFFMTETFFSPDPYCGYEYTEGSEPIGDPRGSGGNRELKPLGDGWWWLCAS
jgi:hypothetical protein